MSRKRQTSPDGAQKIAAHARQHVPCQDCAAGPGEPCTGPGAGRSVHKSRYIASAIAIKQRDKAARRTPEQEAN